MLKFMFPVEMPTSSESGLNATVRFLDILQFRYDYLSASPKEANAIGFKIDQQWQISKDRPEAKIVLEMVRSLPDEKKINYIKFLVHMGEYELVKSIIGDKPKVLVISDIINQLMIEGIFSLAKIKEVMPSLDISGNSELRLYINFYSIWAAINLGLLPLATEMAKNLELTPDNKLEVYNRLSKELTALGRLEELTEIGHTFPDIINEYPIHICNLAVLEYRSGSLSESTKGYLINHIESAIMGLSAEGESVSHDEEFFLGFLNLGIMILLDTCEKIGLVTESDRIVSSLIDRIKKSSVNAIKLFIQQLDNLKSEELSEKLQLIFDAILDRVKELAEGAHNVSEIIEMTVEMGRFQEAQGIVDNIPEKLFIQPSYFNSNEGQSIRLVLQLALVKGLIRSRAYDLAVEALVKLREFNPLQIAAKYEEISGLTTHLECCTGAYLQPSSNTQQRIWTNPHAIDGLMGLNNFQAIVGNHGAQAAIDFFLGILEPALLTISPDYSEQEYPNGQIVTLPPIDGMPKHINFSGYPMPDPNRHTVLITRLIDAVIAEPAISYNYQNR